MVIILRIWNVSDGTKKNIHDDLSKILLKSRLNCIQEKTEPHRIIAQQLSWESWKE